MTRDETFHRNSSRTMNVQFTGQGCTELVRAIQQWTNWGFKAILKYNNEIKFRELISHLTTTRKLFHSQKSKTSLNSTLSVNQKDVLNIVSKSNVHQEVKSKTIYVGNHQSDNGAKGMCI